jgi:hypothetical protein
MGIYRPPSPDVRRYSEARRFSRNIREGGFDYLLRRWTNIVAAVEAGYRLTFYEYLNDLDARRIIDELATHASDEEWAEVEAALPSLDERFRKATQPVNASLYGGSDEQKSKYHPDRDWYYFRESVDLSHVRDRVRWP